MPAWLQPIPQEVPDSQDWGCRGAPVPPRPAPGWAGGMGLVSQALTCHPGQSPLPPDPREQLADTVPCH